MSGTPDWRRYLRLLGPDPERDVDDELAFHIDMRTRDYIARGMTPRTARLAATRRFGDLSRVRGECQTIERRKERAMSRARVLEETMQDVRWAIRSLVRRPTFTIVAAVTLALGIGANTAIFSVVNAYLLQPLPVRGGDRLTVIAATVPGTEMPSSISWPNYLDIRARRDLFEDVVAFDNSLVGLRFGNAESHRRFIERTSGNYFSMLGVRAAVGRTYTEGDAERREPLIVLGHATWREQFGGDSTVIGKPVHINGVPFTIAGVAPEGFEGLRRHLIRVDAFIATSTQPLLDPRAAALFDRRDWASFRTYALLKPGVSMEQARAGLRVLSAQLARQYPDVNAGISLVIAPETRSRPDISVSHVMPWIAAVFMILVGLVLLIACANVANLLLARAAARQSEIALRRALGATPARVLRQVITESVVLAFLGLSGGVLLAWWILRWLTSIRLSTDVPARFLVTPDWRVAAFGVAAALAAGILAGLVPALQGARVSLNEVLKEGGRGAGGARRNRLRGALVVTQVAVSVVLLVCAGLFMRSVRAASAIDLGFRNTNLLMLSTDVGLQRYDSVRTEAFFDRLLERAAALPGVRAAALSGDVPLGYNNTSTTVFFDRDIGVEGNQLDVLYNAVSPAYFATLGYPVLDGRAFTDRDDRDAPRVVVINATMAERIWPGERAVGKRIRLEKGGAEVEVVGVVKAGRYVFLSEDPRLFMYFPLKQRPRSDRTLQILTAGDPAALAAPARQLVRELDSELVVYDLKTMRSHLRDGLAFLFIRLAATLAGGVGLLGLIQTVVGLYGVVSYAVSQRTREIGIRMALGARARDVLRSVMGQGLLLSLIGVAIGSAAALVVTRTMSSLLVGVRATDVATFAGCALILIAVSLISTLIPARRAARLQPVEALRDIT